MPIFIPDGICSWMCTRPAASSTKTTSQPEVASSAKAPAKPKASRKRSSPSTAADSKNPEGASLKTTGNKREEKEKKSLLKALYKSEKHHRAVGNNERADQFRKRSEALEKELYGF